MGRIQLPSKNKTPHYLLAPTAGKNIFRHDFPSYFNTYKHRNARPHRSPHQTIRNIWISPYMYLVLKCYFIRIPVSSNSLGSIISMLWLYGQRLLLDSPQEQLSQIHDRQILHRENEQDLFSLGSQRLPPSLLTHS